MKARYVIVGAFAALVLSVGAVLVVAGCGSSDESPPGPSNEGDASFDTGLPSFFDATGDGRLPVPDAPDVLSDGTPPDASAVQLRFAWLVNSLNGSPTGGVDLCLSPHGAGVWQGPLLGAAGAVGGFKTLGASAYQSFAPGRYDVRVLDVGATSCDVDGGVLTTPSADGGPRVPVDFTDLPALTPGDTFTLAFFDGVAPDTYSPPFTAKLFTDETSVTPGKVKLRFVDLATNITDPATYGLGGGAVFEPLFPSVTSTEQLDPGADTLGYREIDPLASIDLSLYSPGGGLGFVPAGILVTPDDYLSTSALSIPDGTIVTTFATEEHGAANYFMMVTCVDRGASATGGLTPCVVQDKGEEVGYTRFANFLADPSAPAVDVCIRHQGRPSFVGPLLANAAAAVADAGADASVPTTSLSPPGASSAGAATVSGYFAIHSGFAYDVRVVAAGSATCATGLGPDAVYVAPMDGQDEDDYATLALTGFLNGPGESDAGADAGLDASIDAGDGSAPPSTSFAVASFIDSSPSTGLLYVRLVHVGARAPDPVALTAPWTLATTPYDRAVGSGRYGYTFEEWIDETPLGTVTVQSSVGGASDAGADAGTGTSFAGSGVLYNTDWLTFYVYTYGVAKEPAIGVLECFDGAHGGGIPPEGLPSVPGPSTACVVLARQ